MSNPTVLIDGNSLMNIFYAASLPDEVKKAEDVKKQYYYYLIPRNRYGVYVNALRLFTKYIAWIINAYAPYKFAVIFDSDYGEAFRKKRYPEYKGNRKPSQLPLKEQIDICQFWLNKCQIPVYLSGNYEADDLIASFASHESSVGDVFVVTADHDYLQMVTDRVSGLFYIPNGKIFDNLKAKYPNNCSQNHKFCLYTHDLVKTEYGLEPFQIADLKALSGDASDNYPGVPRIGEVSAKALLSIYPSVDDIYRAVESTNKEVLVEMWKAFGIKGASGLIDTLKDNKDKAMLFKWIATAQAGIEVPVIPYLNWSQQGWAEFLEFVSS